MPRKHHKPEEIVTKLRQVDVLVSHNEDRSKTMDRDPQVDLIFSHFIPRYEASGVDPNDMRALIPRIMQWPDWCRLWSEEGARHEKLGREGERSARS